MFTDINIYSINNKKDHISEKYIFYRKKVDIFPILGRIRNRIRIRYFTKRIRGSGSRSISKWNGSETLVFLIIFHISGPGAPIPHPDPQYRIIIYVTGEMDPSGKSVPPGSNLTGGMESGMNTNI